MRLSPSSVAGLLLSLLAFANAGNGLSKDGDVTKFLERVPVVGLVVSAGHAIAGNTPQAQRATVKNLNAICETGAAVGGGVAGFVVAGPAGAYAGAAAGGAAGAAAGHAIEASLAPHVACDIDDLECMAKHNAVQYVGAVTFGAAGGAVGAVVGASGGGLANLGQAVLNHKAGYQVLGKHGAENAIKHVGKRFVAGEICNVVIVAGPKAIAKKAQKLQEPLVTVGPARKATIEKAAMLQQQQQKKKKKKSENGVAS